MPTADVVIIGLGPVGAAGAILCARHGLNVTVIEKTTGVYPLPRAVAMDGEIVRAFQQFGLGNELDEILQTTRPGDRAGFANSKREWLFGQDMVAFAGNGWQATSMFDQPEVETWLRDVITRLDNITVHLGYEVVGWSEAADHVRVEYMHGTDQTRHHIDCQYVIACDGAASPTRKQLGIGWRDLGYDREWLVVDVTVNDNHTLGNDTLQVCDPDRIVTYVCTKDPYRRWEFRLNPGETGDEMLQDETIHALIQQWTPAASYSLRRKAVYQFHAATAERWRDGSVFIAGDAAHQTPPFLGQGMNAGMRDVINLAWKLPLVLSDRATDALLDSYEAERKPHAEDLVEWAVALGRLMEHTAAVEAAERAGHAPPDRPVQQAAGYGQGREAPPLRDGVVLVDQVSDRGSTGYLFSQPIVQTPDGAELRLDDCYGPGFVLVTRVAVTLAEDVQDVMDTLGMAVFSLAGTTAVRGHFDRLFEQADAAIVRPDRYVFGHTTPEMDANDLVRALAAKLALA